MLISLRNTSKWQSLGNLLPNPISPVHQGTSHVFPKQNKMQNNKYLSNPKCLLELNWVLTPGNMRSWNAWGQQKRNSTRKSPSWPPPPPFLPSKGNFEECEASCPGPSPTSLCALFYHFWLCPFSRHSDALILIMAATIFWVLAMSQALT